MRALLICGYKNRIDGKVRNHTGLGNWHKYNFPQPGSWLKLHRQVWILSYWVKIKYNYLAFSYYQDKSTTSETYRLLFIVSIAVAWGIISEK